MKYLRCQALNREGVRFCEECGARLGLSCLSCGAEVIPDKKFCGSCGAPLAAQSPDRFALPGRILPNTSREDSHLEERA